jgi:hypothetical protein
VKIPGTVHRSWTLPRRQVPLRTSISRQLALALSHTQSLKGRRGARSQWRRGAASTVLGAHPGAESIAHAPIAEVRPTKESCKAVV